MNFVVVGYMGAYGSMGQWVADVLRQIGHDVKAIDRNEKIPIERAIYFFVDCSEDYSVNMPAIPFPKVFWSMDAHMPGGLERASNIARKCDLVLSSNYEHGVKLLATVGIKSVLMPITYRGDYFGNEIKTLDVAMVGNPNSQERLKLWSMLGKYNGFAGKIDTLELYSHVMNNAKIVINQPTEPWDNILNNRFFEGIGCGALLLQKRLKTNLIEKLGFENGVDFLYWNNLDELPTIIDTVLANYGIYKGILQSGYDKVRNYEMKIQMQKIVGLILNKFYDRL